MPLFWLSIAFILGILLGGAGNLPWGIWIAGALCSLVLVLSRAVRRRGRISGSRLGATRLPPLAALLLAASLGGLRYQASLPPQTPDFIAWYNDTGVEMTVVGLVVEPPDERDTYANLRVRVERLRPAGEVLHTSPGGLLLARLPPGGGWHYGDRVVLTGVLETPPEEEEFSYRDYLARKGIYSFMPEGRVALLEAGKGSPLLAGLFALKEHAEAVIYQIFPDPEASLAAGILLGVETGIPEGVRQAFTDTGTSHVIAISG